MEIINSKPRSLHFLFLFTVWNILSRLDVVSSECDTCHTGNPTACHNETAYSLCIDGVPTYNLVNCPSGYVCTKEPRVCYPKEGGASPFCPPEESRKTRCDVCDNVDQVFACLNETTIAFCFGQSLPNYRAIAYCPPNTVCDLDNPEFCSDIDAAEPSCTASTVATEGSTTITTESPTSISKETETTITQQTTPSMTTMEKDILIDDKSTTTTTAATTATTTIASTESTTTTKTVQTPATMCRELKTTGFYRYDGDPTCKSYAQCYQNSDGTWTGIKLTCPTKPQQQYFNNNGACMTVKPDDCL